MLVNCTPFGWGGGGGAQYKGVHHRKIATQEDCHRKVAVNFDLALFGQWNSYLAPVELVSGR